MEPSAAPPIEVAGQFFAGLNEPRPTCVGFSRDGMLGFSSHLDNAIRIVDANSLTHSQTIFCDSCGVSAAVFTQSSSVLCIAPEMLFDGHLYLLNVETASFIGALGYVNDLAPEIPLTSMPVYSTVSQCPTTDILGAVIHTKGALALFHPLVSGAVAVSQDKLVGGYRAFVTFSSDGNGIAVGCDDHVSLLDRRMLLSGPVRRLSSIQLFRRTPARCRGVEFPNEGGERLLVTSSLGEVNVFNLKKNTVECSYFHGQAMKLFDGSKNNVPARYLNPHLRSSRVIQLTSSLSDGRHMLVYHPNPKQDASVSMSTEEGGEELVWGALAYQLQCKDSDIPVDVAVNPRLQVIATAARHVCWWCVNN